MLLMYEWLGWSAGEVNFFMQTTGRVGIKQKTKLYKVTLRYSEAHTDASRHTQTHTNAYAL